MRRRYTGIPCCCCTDLVRSHPSHRTSSGTTPCTCFFHSSSVACHQCWPRHSHGRRQCRRRCRDHEHRLQVDGRSGPFLLPECTAGDTRCIPQRQSSGRHYSVQQNYRVCKCRPPWRCLPVTQGFTENSGAAERKCVGRSITDWDLRG